MSFPDIRGHVTTSYFLLYEKNTDCNPSFVAQKVVIHTTIDIQKVSTGKSPVS